MKYVYTALAAFAISGASVKQRISFNTAELTNEDYTAAREAFTFKRSKRRSRRLLAKSKK